VSESKNTLTPCQQIAVQCLEKSDDNIFLTGVAGSGKSYVIDTFIKGKDRKLVPVVASTGAAAVLLGGRTFHSYFGVGILEGGPEVTVKRALENVRVVKRLKKAHTVVIDEVSMLPGQVLKVAEEICRRARHQMQQPWGGIRIVAVGDFAQLPPVNRHGIAKDWAFRDEVWGQSQFKDVLLKTVVRTKDPKFLSVLNQAREGVAEGELADFLESRQVDVPYDFEATRLYPFRQDVEAYNLTRLSELAGEPKRFPTIYVGEERFLPIIKREAPVPEVINLKKGAFVMIRQNDPSGNWVNGSLGTISYLTDEVVEVKLVSGLNVSIEPVEFSLLNAEGMTIATAKNFPLNLAYATTIHKAQGMTLDRVVTRLMALWEPGQGYVAMSRAKSSEGLFVAGWEPKSFVMDPAVREFYAQLYSVQ
jgi:ATP-dependent DNA helicase PIF1